MNDAMYVSASANVLSISGYHMAIVTGVVFFAIRAGLALVPALALRRPIKYLRPKSPASCNLCGLYVCGP